MLRIFLWLTGAMCLGYLSYRFAAWRVFGQVALVWMFLLWVVVLGWLLARSYRARDHASKPSDINAETMRAAVYRQNYVSKYGADRAAALERENPYIWRDYVRSGATEP